MQIEDLNATVSQLRDQTRLLSAAANTGVVPAPGISQTNQYQPHTSVNNSTDFMKELDACRHQVQQWRAECERLQAHVAQLVRLLFYES